MTHLSTLSQEQFLQLIAQLNQHSRTNLRGYAEEIITADNEKWWNEISVLRFYTSEAGKQYNNLLKQHCTDSNTVAFAQAANYAIRQLVTAKMLRYESGNFYRGSGYGTDGIAERNEFETFTQHSLLSSTTSLKRIWQYEEGCVITIKACAALDIRWLSHHDEEEFLFPMNSKFRVIKKEQDKANKLCVTLEQIA
jgi:hypothetical protein